MQQKRKLTLRNPLRKIKNFTSPDDFTSLAERVRIFNVITVPFQIHHEVYLHIIFDSNQSPLLRNQNKREPARTTKS